jgi:hypothetical protein
MNLGNPAPTLGNMSMEMAGVRMPCNILTVAPTTSLAEMMIMARPSP